jgi:hypothetical protein
MSSTYGYDLLRNNAAIQMPELLSNLQVSKSIVEFAEGLDSNKEFNPFEALGKMLGNKEALWFKHFFDTIYKEVPKLRQKDEINTLVEAGRYSAAAEVLAKELDRFRREEPEEMASIQKNEKISAAVKTLFTGAKRNELKAQVKLMGCIIASTICTYFIASTVATMVSSLTKALAISIVTMAAFQMVPEAIQDKIKEVAYASVGVLEEIAKSTHTQAIVEKAAVCIQAAVSAITEHVGIGAIVKFGSKYYGAYQENCTAERLAKLFESPRVETKLAY